MSQNSIISALRRVSLARNCELLNDCLAPSRNAHVPRCDVSRNPRRVNSNVNQNAQPEYTCEADVYHPTPGCVTNVRFAPGTLAPPRVGSVRRFVSSPSAEDTAEANAYAYRQAVEENPLAQL